MSPDKCKPALTWIAARHATCRMPGLKQELAGILDLFDPASPIVYIDYPLHTNVGDLLINLGTERFFADNGLQVRARYSLVDLPRHRLREADGKTTLVCHGGGNFGDLYPKHQAAREWLVRSHPDSRIICLPQSVHFSSDRALDSMTRAFRSHRNYHVLARDAHSCAFLRAQGINTSSMPDMAHQLWGVIESVAGARLETPLYFFRNDLERTDVPDELRSVKSARDWRSLATLPDKAFAFAMRKFLNAVAVSQTQLINTRLWYAARDRLIVNAVRKFSQHPAVVTNRLHAMILALLLNLDVAYFDNSYGKLTRYADTWLNPSSIPAAVGEPLIAQSF